MRPRSLMALGVVSITVGLVGWSAYELGAWPRSSVERDSFAEIAGTVAPPVVEPPQRVVATAPEPRSDAAPADFGWPSSLLNSQPVAPSQPLAEAIEPPLEAGPAVEGPVPMPRPRPGTSAASAARKDKRKPDNFNGRLTVAQIAHIKQRLRLTAEQEEHWRPVEAVLRDLVRKQEEGGRLVALSATESQNLYFAAGPLVMSLREDQKEEARNLARAMGLPTVADLI